MRRAALVSSLLLLLGLAAWANDEIRMLAGPTNPAAAGIVELDRDHNGNTMLKLKVHHMAQPSSLVPPKNAYVVWLQSPGREPEVAGQLRTDKDLNGAFETRTPFKNFEVFITAEDTPHPEQPSGPVVLRATVQQ